MGNAKAEFISRATAGGNYTVEHCAIVMANIMKHLFPAFAYRDQKRYLSWYLRKPTGMKVEISYRIISALAHNLAV